MVTFDFSTVYMAVLASNVLLIIIAIILSNKKIMINAGYKLITSFLVLTVLRFLLPIEVPFATTISLPEGISFIIYKLNEDFYHIGNFAVDLIRIACLVWFIGVAIQTCRYVKSNNRIRRYIYMYGRDVTNDADIRKITSKIVPNASFPLHIYSASAIQSPFLYGIIRPVIVIPKEFEQSEKELEYTLRHEVTHYYRHDLLVKFGVRVLTILYWWNPFSYMLLNQMNLLLEMRIDDTVVQLGEEAVTEYMHCLLHMKEQQNNIVGHPMGNTISFFHGKEDVLKKRFQMLMKRNKRKNHVINALLLVLVSFIYVASYAYTFEADYMDPTIKESNIIVSELNCYIIQTSKNTYDVYLNDILIETVDSIEYFYDDTIPIYTQEEFERVQKEKLEQN